MLGPPSEETFNVKEVARLSDLQSHYLHPYTLQARRSESEKTHLQHETAAASADFVRKCDKQLPPLWRIIGSVSAYVAINFTVRQTFLNYRSETLP